MPSIANKAVLDVLEKRLRTLRSDSARRWGTLTPGEMVCHLGDAATNVIGRPGDPSAGSRPFRKLVGLHSWLPWPKGVETTAQNNPKLEGTRPGDFEQDRERAIKALQELALVPAASLPSSHRVFGTMSHSDWLIWAYKHTDHHLRQFWL